MATTTATATAPSPWSTPFSSTPYHEFPTSVDDTDVENDEEEEEFFETLDRILSSGSSDDELANTTTTTTSSSSTLPPPPPPLPGSSSQRHRRHTAPYDLWLSPPSSVQERRGRLLLQLGLSPDPHGHSSSNLDRSPDHPAGVNASAPPVANNDTPQQQQQQPLPKVMGSPIAQELLRRESGDEAGPLGPREGARRKGWLKSLRHMASAMVYRNERKEKRRSGDGEGGDESTRRSSTVGDGDVALQLAFFQGLERVRVRVRQAGRGAWRELTGMFVMQEVRAHAGAVWSVRFSVDGRYLASAGEDCVVRVWEASEVEWKGKRDGGHVVAVDGGAVVAEDEGSKELSCRSGRRRGKGSSSSTAGSRRFSFSLENMAVPEKVFALSEKPVCSFHGHSTDVLDLSWSKSELLLSASMDKTVKMWTMSDGSCLRTFSHNDFVTCIQFNPSDDNYFISGSLDTKVRIWSIGNCKVVHWSDMHEMVTAVCYTPDGQGAFVGSNKGSCHLYDISDNKMQLKSKVKLYTKKKRSSLKKITGFQFVPRSSSEVFVTSADSRIRVVDDLKVVHKFKGFRNKTSQISASLTADGGHVVCASEDSQVYVWRYDPTPEPTRTLQGDAATTATQSYEYFHCKHVTVAAAWPRRPNGARAPSSAVEGTSQSGSISGGNSPRHPHSERASATWPEEKLSVPPTISAGAPELQVQGGSSAWGMAIVAAGRGGEIKVFQNFGHPSHT